MKPAAVAVGSVEEVTVHALSSHGAGVGRLSDGRTVFVPRTAPGERVRIRLERVKPRWAKGTMVEVMEPSPDRREPLCSLYDTCGGCQLQHLPESMQRAWKARFVADALERIAGFEDVPVPEVLPSPRDVGYRSRMSFTLRRLRDGRVVAGLHALDRPAHVVEIADECVLPEPEILSVWTGLRAAWGTGARALPRGGQLRLTLRRDLEEHVTLVVEGGLAPWDPTALLDEVEGLTAVVHRPRGESEELQVGAVEARLGFVQANEDAATLLRAHVAEQAEGARTVVDAYCGDGAFGRVLAEDGVEVVGLEMDPHAAREAPREGSSPMEIRVGSVERLLPGALPTDLLIVNPPRTGLDSAVVDAILACPPDRVLYVSCDPATLARDLSRLAQRYELDGLRCFDLFPQTAHVETVVGLNLRRDP